MLLALLLRLVSVQFPDKIEEEVAQVVPLLFEVDNFIEDEFEEEAVPDDYVTMLWILTQRAMTTMRRRRTTREFVIKV